MRIIETILDVLWPRRCEGCGRAVDRPGRYLCSDCHMRLPWVGTDGLCRRCGREAVGLKGDFLCDECRTGRPHFDRVATAFRFEGLAREMINNFKFREKLHLRNELVDALEAAVRVRMKVEKLDCVVPMPSTFAHRFLRGYNQCAYLSSALARRLKKPCRNLLRRVGTPRRQGGLAEEERRTNVLDTFVWAGGCVNSPPRRVLLVDDILTTGSTLDEAARTLKRAGVREVYAATLARSSRL